ncbi:MAG: hypothetical protein ACK4YQ_06550, partial [Phenylobacterium sp.]
MYVKLAFVSTLVLAGASQAASAQPALDRYGPPRADVRLAAAAPAYGGRMLTWASKVEPPAAAAPQPSAPAPRAADPRAYSLGDVEAAPAPAPASLYDSPPPAPAAASAVAAAPRITAQA